MTDLTKSDNGQKVSFVKAKYGLDSILLEIETTSENTGSKSKHFLSMDKNDVVFYCTAILRAYNEWYVGESSNKS